MRTTTPVLVAAVALAGSALAQEDAQLEITSLSAQLPVGAPYGYTGSTSLTVTVSYPANGTTQSTTCSTSWPSTPEPFTTWATCTDPNVQWRVPTSGWAGTANFDVDFFVTTSVSGAGLTGSHGLDMNPGNTTDPNAYLSCIEYGKFTPLTCSLGGPLSALSPPVAVPVTSVAALPSRRSLGWRAAKPFAA